jgi:hypothetical protein
MEYGIGLRTLQQTWWLISYNLHDEKTPTFKNGTKEPDLL